MMISIRPQKPSLFLWWPDCQGGNNFSFFAWWFLFPHKKSLFLWWSVCWVGNNFFNFLHYLFFARWSVCWVGNNWANWQLFTSHFLLPCDRVPVWPLIAIGKSIDFLILHSIFQSANTLSDISWSHWRRKNLYFLILHSIFHQSDMISRAAGFV